MIKAKQNISFKKLVIFFIFVAVLILFRAVLFFITHSESQQITTNPAVSQVSACTRTVSYEMPPEFGRAISIIKQKMTSDDSFLNKFENCLNVQYDQLKNQNEGPEGVFMFDRAVSSPDSLKILVDNSYKNEDDYMTAVLLVHEITHAKQFYEGSDLSCVDKEVHAFWNEFLLLTNLNSGEKKSITARMYNPISLASLPIKALDNLIETIKVADAKCRGNKSCTQSESAELLKKQIESSPYYQEQCKNND